MRFAGLMVALVFASCIDYGYDLPARVATDADALATDTGTQTESDCQEGPTSPNSAGTQIHFGTLSVDLPNVVINTGDTVTWTNGDSMSHTVTAGAPGAELPTARGGFSSGDIAPGSQWAYHFCRARSVFYFCATHPQQMNGYKIEVQ